MPTKTMTENKRPWSIPVRIETVPDEGAHFDVSADDNTRAAIAALTNLQALNRLEASFDLTRRDRRLHVVGEISATVGQVCVVTLEPVENEIREVVDLVFAPGIGEPQAGADATDTLGESEDLDSQERGDLSAGEPPEGLVDGTVDLGGLAVEFLLLGIDPYPRKPDVVFEATSVGEASSHPFAALAKLKEKRDPGSE
jgi:uncharacterized metal-binding protein YceD (DUF177 family)